MFFNETFHLNKLSITSINKLGRCLIPFFTIALNIVSHFNHIYTIVTRLWNIYICFDMISNETNYCKNKTFSLIYNSI